MRNINLMIFDLATAGFSTIIELIRCAGAWRSAVHGMIGYLAFRAIHESLLQLYKLYGTLFLDSY